MTETLIWWKAVLLGILQGLTEFLPVSSSGHLALAEAWLDVPGAGVAFAVLLHAGTLLAIALVFREGIFDLVRGVLAIPGQLGRSPTRWPREARFVALVAVATVPGAIVGLLLEDRIEAAFASPGPIARATSRTVEPTGTASVLPSGNRIWSSLIDAGGTSAFTIPSGFG